MEFVRSLRIAVIALTWMISGSALASDPSCDAGASDPAAPHPQRIYGTVIGMSPLCVNGFLLETPAETRFLRDGRSSNRASLGLGHVVRIETSGEPPLVAKRIDIDFALAGAIDQIDVETRTLKILRTQVHVRRDALIRDVDGSNQSLYQLARGEHLEVSGLRRPDGSVEATRLDVRPAGSPDHVTGIALPIGRDTMYVEKVRGHTANRLGFDPEMRGKRVQLRGEWDDVRQQIREAFARERSLASHGTRSLSLEAIAVASDASVELGFTATPIRVSNGLDRPVTLREGSRVHVVATRIEGQAWIARSIALLEDDDEGERIRLPQAEPETEPSEP